ncbi:hypothetical protein CspHIS471_0102410 [Cutaneotrichosporon sp. HIS471]|nr:hypothetical protein CspHIS471_0102410 [Cutaneotrichosporon sp. HIS471]
MGDHRDRSRSPRKHRDERKSDRRDRDRDRDRDREHHKSRSDRDRDRDRDRERRDRRDDRDREHDRDHGRRDETEEEQRERKRAKRERERDRERDREARHAERRERRRAEDSVRVVDDDEAGGDWVEKDVDASSAVAHGERSPPSLATETTRESWMLREEDRVVSSSVARDAPVHSAGDFFSALGTEHKRKDPNEKKAEPPKHSKYELNTQMLEGKTVDEYKAEDKKTVQAGGPGYQWRMMKLKRLYEQAEDQGKTVEAIALERYGSLDEFRDAVEERRVLDEREAKRKVRRGGSDTGNSSSSGMRTPDARDGTPARRFLFNDDSRPPSRQGGFRRPGEERDSTPSGRVDALRREGGGAKPTGQFGTPAGATPIPSVFTPQALTRGPSGEEMPRQLDGQPVMTIEQLNRLQAKVLRAKLTDDPDAEALEEQYDSERARFDDTGASAEPSGTLRTDEKGNKVEVAVLPTLDGQGKLYDVGLGKEDETPHGKKRKKEPKFETRDREGNLLRYNADDDDITLGEMVRQERFGGGAAGQKNLDAEMAARIATDARFDNNLDYMDDNADRLARRKMKTDAMKRQFAINDYRRTKKALDECPFCFQEDRNPDTAIVALGKRTYMCCTLTEELVPGHCLIVPIQHNLSTLQMDDDDWDEVRNFMKCLMRMWAAENKGVLFYETICSFRKQLHTYIECVPVKAELFADAPAFFRESILASESEWSQHKKLIDFSTRPGGFRRMLHPNVPYFMVQWDYKGEKGYGHVIEGVDDAGGAADDPEGMVDEGDKGGGRFPPYFAAEIIGNVLNLEPRKWLRPRKMDLSQNKERARALGTKFQPYNWTVALQDGAE